MSNLWMRNVWDVFYWNGRWTILGRFAGAKTPEVALSKAIKKEIPERLFNFRLSYHLAVYDDVLYRAVFVYDADECEDTAPRIKAKKKRKLGVCMDCNGITGDEHSKRCLKCFRLGRKEGRIDSRGKLI